MSSGEDSATAAAIAGTNDQDAVKSSSTMKRSSSPCETPHQSITVICENAERRDQEQNAVLVKKCQRFYDDLTTIRLFNDGEEFLAVDIRISPPQRKVATWKTRTLVTTSMIGSMPQLFPQSNSDDFPTYWVESIWKIPNIFEQMYFSNCRTTVSTGKSA
jgi:hypothetical protein